MAIFSLPTTAAGICYLSYACERLPSAHDMYQRDPIPCETWKSEVNCGSYMCCDVTTQATTPGVRVCSQLTYCLSSSMVASSASYAAVLPCRLQPVLFIYHGRKICMAPMSVPVTPLFDYFRGFKGKRLIWQAAILPTIQNNLESLPIVWVGYDDMWILADFR